MVDQYIFSGSLPEEATTYVTRSADSELYTGLKAGKFCYVLNSRQSGKSSLRVQIMSRLREEGVKCAAIDLSAGGIQNVPPEQWYVDLIDTLIGRFDLDLDFADWWSANQLNSLVTRFRKFLEEILLAEVKENIVIFIDEIDSVLSLEFPTDDFFALIRACYNKRVDNPEYNRLTFCLLGVASPSNLIEDKQRTPFNIGKAISLKGFQLHEVEPLEKGLHGKFSDTQAVMKEILHWTGGQPFLTQKLCQFMVEESQSENPRSVEQVVRSRIIENWESQDEPEHLRTIRARILRDEQRAGYLLELYQMVRLDEGQSSLSADDTLEQSELQLSGLVVRQHNKLRVYNPIYQEIFADNWIENQLKNLRPYSESFRFWVASIGTDESRLLRRNALREALEWAKDKNLSYQDRQFLAASKEKEIQEEIASQEKEAQLERERKNREAAEQRNIALTKANKKARQRIRNGTVILVLTLFGAAVSVILAREEVKEAQQKLKETYTYVAYPQQLKELADKFPSDSQTARLISKKATIKIKDGQIEQVYLHASKSLAYQDLGDLKSAEKSIKQSMNFLRGWNENKEEKEVIESKSEFLQIEIFALTVQGNLLRKQNNTPKAMDAYKEAFNILQSSKIDHFNEEFSIVGNGESLSKSLSQNYLDLLVTQNKDNLQLETVRKSLKEYSFADLKYFLKAKQWKEANDQTYRLMLHIAEREKEGYLDYDNINSFSCPDLQRIDQLWVSNSDNRFGFSVQKKIWINTGNRLSTEPGQWNNKYYDNYLQFAKAVRWYNNEGNSDDKYVDEYERLIKSNLTVGSLPLLDTNNRIWLEMERRTENGNFSGGRWKEMLAGTARDRETLSLLFSRCDL